jgi:hypothetical protein
MKRLVYTRRDFESANLFIKIFHRFSTTYQLSVLCLEP